MANAITKSVEDLEIAINQFLETNDQDVFKPFIGKCSKLEPYGELELGKAINGGDMDIISKLIYKLSDLEGEMHYFDDNNSQTGSSSSSEQTDANLEKQLEELDQVDKDKETLKNSEQEKQLYKALKENADKNKPGIIGDKFGKGSKLAAKDSLKYEQKIKEASNTNRAKQDDAYLDSKKEILNTFKPKELSDEGLKDKLKAWQADHKIFSELRGNKMEISKKDIEKLMSAMKTVQNFAAEKAKDEVVEDEVETTENEETETENKNIVVEMPEDIAETVRDALNTALDEEEEEPETEEEAEEEDFSEDDTESEEDVDDTESEEDFCGDSENFSMNSFYEFSKAITETIENLNKKADKLAGKEIEGADEFIENFSITDFRNFAESVVETLENINTRISMLDSKVAGKDEVTTNLDAINKIANDYEDNFITKSDEDMNKETDPIVQNPEYGVVENAQFSQRYENVKNFLSL